MNIKSLHCWLNTATKSTVIFVALTESIFF